MAVRGRAGIDGAPLAGCLEPHEIQDFIDGALTPVTLRSLESHLGQCSECRDVVEDVAHTAITERHGRVRAGSTFGEAATDVGQLPPIMPGQALGRYLALYPVGSGAMGVVWAAVDRQLGRKVALKLLAAENSGESAQARMVREAQAMARLSHPNVVHVYDIGFVDDHLFVAMELVEGTNLRQWSKAARRPWPEVLAMFEAAGRGLAAAHKVGIVHRDFKPENVLIRDVDQVALVTDFGLARMGAEEGATGSLTSGPVGVPASPLVTHTGAVLGTPAYMAPEQLMAGPVDPRADQFSFCVALFEGLYGQRPFAGATEGELLDDILGDRVEPPVRGDVPEHVRDALMRGLRAEPAARWPSMEDLLARFHVRPAGRWRRWAVGAVAAAVVAAGAVLVGQRAAGTSSAAPSTDSRPAPTERTVPAPAPAASEAPVQAAPPPAESTPPAAPAASPNRSIARGRKPARRVEHRRKGSGDAPQPQRENVDEPRHPDRLKDPFGSGSAAGGP